MKINFETFSRIAASIKLLVPITFVFTASKGFSSQISMCFIAAAWNTISIFLIANLILSISRTSPTMYVSGGLLPKILLNSKIEFSSFERILIVLGLYLINS